ncbi:isoprenoid biosynthesis glyoxalase ElbB [candidate division KSB3 bacterium]|uniref:Isoprenoid biosynthesis glyoxalase ElbB n=1 Tax=candidate division KSB3 bacterium TaxID=2044937 RepID=A0A9D5JTX5_9BACT|nr:isoprenoid biosynthesis glyoxalase ElbB [candidate division KSB3 bacterium]MBD3324034.1 isoprenoid biosynthesis glyoxalase ElbB [candidate division KSB3 bacterium]
MAKTVGVVLAGCGVFDGSEIHEAVLTLLALDRQGVEVLCMAPNMNQMHVVNHATQEATDETRNVLVESARIARGDIRDIAEVTAAELDALMFPGGFGAAKNLCDFAVNGADCAVHPEVERLVKAMLEARKPLAAVCIAPALIARITGKQDIQAKLTIGTDQGTAQALETMGATHVACQVKEITVDTEHRIVSGPAYMLGENISDVADGIEQVVKALVAMIP